MRKDAKKTINAETTHQQGYHGGRGAGSNYAFRGFEENRYWASDRYEKLDANFNRAGNKPLMGYGTEWEIESASINDDSVLATILDKVVFEHLPNGLFKHQHDGSLGGASSDEAITGVMTKEFIRNHYAGFKYAWDMMGHIGMSCDSGNCGMHVNVSNGLFGKTTEKQADNVKKLGYILSHHYKLCCALLYRNARRTGYCRQMECFMTKERAQRVDLDAMYSDHSVCFNVAHFREGRVEIRLVGGQANYACWRNTMECVFHLVGAVNHLSWADLDDVTKIFDGCNAYVYDRLKTLVHDAGAITEAELNAITHETERKYI